MISRHCLGARAAGPIPLLLATLIGLSGCDRLQPPAGAAGPARQPPAPVTIAAAVEKDMPLELHAIGRVQPFTTVTVKPQVSGQLAQTHFVHGQDVKTGDLLFTIDSRPFQTALEQAQATLEKNIALMNDALIEAEWQENLQERGLGTQRESQNKRALAESLKAAVAADRAALAKARLDLEYCSIRAPGDGRAGEILAHPGNVVSANETALVVLNQLSPIYVSFSLPERELGRIKRAQSTGDLQVRVEIPGEEQAENEVGVLSFIDNAVDSATGMISLKGTFANANHWLWPGQFVNVTLTLGTRRGAVVVPSAAVQTSQAGQYVFVISEDLVAESRPVVPGFAVGEETIIETGLRAGERVVTDGHLRVTHGTRVVVREPADVGQPAPASRPDTHP